VAPMTPKEFEAWAALSRSFHGNRYVLPLAAWLLRDEVEAASASEAMAGLGGLAERVRVLEGLARLVEIGAMEEMPRHGARNSPRYFARAKSPYWVLVAAYARAIEQGTLGSDPEAIGPGSVSSR
jgi:hypothetical protein